MLRPVIGNQRSRISLIGFEPGPEDFFIIVGPVFKFFASTLITDAFLGWRREETVENCPALAAGQTTRYTFDHHIIVQRKMQHQLQRATHPSEAGIEFLRLGDAAGKSVEHKSATTFSTAHAVGDRINHNVVRYQLAGGHYRCDLLADFGLIRYRGPKNISGGDLWNTILLGHQLGLSTFSRTGKPEQNNPHTALSANVAGASSDNPFDPLGTPLQCPFDAANGQNSGAYTIVTFWPVSMDRCQIRRALGWNKDNP